MPATPVYIICSPRPQVGKTLLARLLSEFLLLKNGNDDQLSYISPTERFLREEVDVMIAIQAETNTKPESDPRAMLSPGFGVDHERNPTSHQTIGHKRPLLDQEHN